jgi:hypothetical protein
MIPYLLAIAGGYLIGSVTDSKLFAKGGKVKRLYAVLRSPMGEIISHIEVQNRDERDALMKFREMGITQIGSIYFTEIEPYYYSKGGLIGINDLVKVKSLDKNGMVISEHSEGKWWVRLDYGKPYEKDEIISEKDLLFLKGNETRLFSNGGGVYDDEEEFYPTSVSDMLGKWDDLVQMKNSLSQDVYLKIPKEKNAEYRILKCITKEYDYYLLDTLMDNWRYNHIKLDSILTKAIDSPYSSLLNLVNNSYVNYIGDDFINEDSEYINGLTKEILKYCVAYKTLNKNEEIFYDGIKKDDENYYLKIVGDVYAPFSEYESCEEMLLDLKYSPFVEEYNMLSLSEYNKCYEIGDDDIRLVLKLKSE